MSDPAIERDQLRRRLSAWLDVPLTVLAIVMVVAIVLELAADLPPDWRARLDQLTVAIWATFASLFILEFALAPAKMAYLKENWLTAISVVLPAFRAVRVFRAARLLRGVRLIRVVTTLNRATRALQGLASYARYGYVLAVTTMVSALGAAAAYYFERDTPGSSIRDLGDATWWAVTTLTTINSGLDPVTFEGRAVGLFLRLFGLGLSGYLTATIAVYLLGPTAREREIAGLRDDVRQLREQLERQ